METKRGFGSGAGRAKGTTNKVKGFVDQWLEEYKAGSGNFNPVLAAWKLFEETNDADVKIRCLNLICSRTMPSLKAIEHKTEDTSPVKVMREQGDVFNSPVWKALQPILGLKEEDLKH